MRGLFYWQSVVAIDDREAGLVISVSDHEGQLLRRHIEWSDLPELAEPNISLQNNHTQFRQATVDGSATRIAPAPSISLPIQHA